MEWFEIGWLVLLVMWPFLIKLMRSRRSRSSQSSAEEKPTPAEQASGEVPGKVGDFLGELRKALGSALELPDLEVDSAAPPSMPREEQEERTEPTGREELIPHVFEEVVEPEALSIPRGVHPTGPRRRRRRSPLVTALLSDLKEPGGLSRAVVIREVLGPPVALRQGDER
jgi:hypothetical protein